MAWLFDAGRDALTTIAGLLAADDDLLCGCWGDHVCLDCAVLAEPAVAGWTTESLQTAAS